MATPGALAASVSLGERFVLAEGLSKVREDGGVRVPTARGCSLLSPVLSRWLTGSVSSSATLTLDANRGRAPVLLAKSPCEPVVAEAWCLWRRGFPRPWQPRAAPENRGGGGRGEERRLPPHASPSPPQELELVEDVWRGEAQDLLSQIAQLQEENKQLMTNLSHKDVSLSEEEFQKHEGESGVGGGSTGGRSHRPPRAAAGPEPRRCAF